MNIDISWFRLWSLVVKEFLQFKRDVSTFAMVISLPILQLILFGMAINIVPKHLPSALINTDGGPFSRTLIRQLSNTQYFNFDHFPETEQQASEMMRTHQVVFVLTIPPDFSRKLVRGEVPSALMEVDGTDPISVAYAMTAINNMMPSVFKYDLPGPLVDKNSGKVPAQMEMHTLYNPNAITQYNIVPGLMGTVLTLTFVMVASMALTRERERGTLETLLSTPLLPMEVIIGKAIPFVFVGYLQALIVLCTAVFFFHIPMAGNPVILIIAILPFILANLSVGVCISSIATTQLEASHFSIFFILPSLLLSGFAFPFKGMPVWAQYIGNCLPMTYFNNIIRGVMLKGNGWLEIWFDLWPILLIMIVTLSIAIFRYRSTLD